MKAFDRRFKLEEINGAGRCPTYLYRWTLLRFKRFQVYLHHFVGNDWSRDLHDHPKRFISIGLWGGYTEETPEGRKTYTAPWIRTFPAEHKHRLFLEQFSSCWTLVVVLKATRGWGFWPAGRFVPWREYVGSAEADMNKDCP